VAILGTVSDKDDLNELLNYPITSSGTLLHLAAKVSNTKYTQYVLDVYK